MYENLLANVPTDLWIGGKWRKSSDGGRFDVLDPATENKIASVASATVEDAKAAIDAASDAFEGWAGKKPRERAEVLRKSFELIMRDAERLAKLITIENGKALSDSRGEVAYAAEFFRWYAEEAVRGIGALSQAPASGADIVVKPAMELGGNAPFIVFEDADIDAAIDGAMIAKMRNMGEACTSANRFYVHEKVHDEFAKKLTAKMAALKVGNGLDDGVAVGPLVNADAKKKVIELVDDAVGKGAKILTGGKPPNGPGHFYPPTVIDAVPDGAAMLREEIFGPVAAIQTFKSDGEVIKRANDTEYGLVAYLYTKDMSRGMRVSEQLDFGMIGLNRGLVSDPAAPFGGMKQSGIGREGAHEGLMEFLETQYISVTW